MKPALIGQPLKQSSIDVLRSEILLCMRSTENFPVPLHVLFDFCLHGDESRVNEFGVALRQLEDAHEVDRATFGKRVFYKLVSTADEAQGSTSRTDVGGSGLSALGGTQCQKGAGDECRASAPDFSILHRPHIVRKKEEVHVELCHKCERMASGHCECGLPVCSAHRYSSDGERNPYGMCGKCQKEITSDVEIFSNGRAQQ